MSRNSENTFLALIAGAIVGVGAGILLAPDEGKNTRKKIKGSLDDATKELKKKVSKLEKELKVNGTKAKGTIEEKIDHIVSKGSEKAEDVIAILEKKLADLKTANAKLKK